MIEKSKNATNMTEIEIPTDSNNVEDDESDWSFFPTIKQASHLVVVALRIAVMFDLMLIEQVVKLQYLAKWKYFDTDAFPILKSLLSIICTNLKCTAHSFFTEYFTDSLY